MRVIKALLYCRVSTKPQAGEDKVSIPDQVREGKKFIQGHGWRFVRSIIDPGISANTLERLGLKDLLSASTLEKFDVVVAWDFDRFFREKRSVAGHILDKLDEHRKQITSVKQPIPIYDPDTYDPRQNDTPYILREMAGLTSGMDNRRRFRTLAKGLKERVEKGYLVNRCNYGYRISIKVENGKVLKLPREIEPSQARVIRRIYREYKERNGYPAIAHGLNRDSIPSPTGKAWTVTTVRKLLMNPVYCGMSPRVSILRNGKRVPLPEEKWILIPGKHKPIVSKTLWDEVQAIRKERRRKSKALGSPSLVSGLVECGYCGYAMCKNGTSGGGYYVCGNYVRTGNCRRNGYKRLRLELEVKQFLFSLLRSQDIYDTVSAQQQEERIMEIKKDMQRLEKLLSDFPAKKDKLFDLYENEDITRAEFLHRKAQHDAVENQYRSALRHKKTLLEKLVGRRVSRGTFERTLKDLKTNWDKCPPEKRKQKIHALLENITIRNQSFRVHLRLPTSSR